MFTHIYAKLLSAGYFLHSHKKDPGVYWVSPCTATLTMCTLGISVIISLQAVHMRFFPTCPAERFLKICILRIEQRIYCKDVFIG